MHTDTDIFGLGEPVLEGHCTAVEAVISEFEDLFDRKRSDADRAPCPGTLPRRFLSGRSVNAVRNKRH